MPDPYAAEQALAHWEVREIPWPVQQAVKKIAREHAANQAQEPGGEDYRRGLMQGALTVMTAFPNIDADAARLIFEVYAAE